VFHCEIDGLFAYAISPQRAECKTKLRPGGWFSPQQSPRQLPLLPEKMNGKLPSTHAMATRRAIRTIHSEFGFPTEILFFLMFGQKMF